MDAPSHFLRGAPDLDSLPFAAAVGRARVLALVGIDYLSVGGYSRNGRETHEILLGAGIWIVEGLDLSRVRPGSVDFVCLPIRLAEGDGAPARAILRERPSRAV
jgi:arylformamidase